METKKLFLPTMFSLTGRTALVTGAAGLLGREHSAALAEAGARVVMTDLNEDALRIAADDLRAGTNAEILTYRMDVTSPSSISAVRADLESRGVTVTRLINNAAIDPKVKESVVTGGAGRLESFDLDQWELEVKIGLTGAIVCAAEFGPGMARAQDGVILNIASDLSVISPDQRLYRKEGLPEGEQSVKPVSYSIIKAGLVGLTRYLATYWAGHNVRSNALSPGGVFVAQDAEFVTRLTSLIPLGRMAEKHEYRGVIQFLCSDAARYLNGQNIVMDGGRSVL